MELILCNNSGIEIRRLYPQKADFDVGGENDFEITIPLGEWTGDIDFGCRVFVPGDETGGIVGGIRTDTSNDTVIIKGLTWRGNLMKKIIEPPKGEAYRKVSGDLNAVIRTMINNEFDGVIKGSDLNTGVSITYQFDRYVTLLDGLKKMLAMKNYKLKIGYVQQEKGTAGYVKVSAVPIVDYSEQIELSQDSKLNFILEKTVNSVNHLIVLGDGELAARNVLHLYMNADGEIVKAPYYTGIDEIAETYEYTSSEDLEADGIKHFEELTKSTEFTMDVESLDLSVDVGDILGGRDYITGKQIKKPLGSKIITYQNGKKSVEYNLEE